MADNVFSLDDLRAAIEREYAPVKIAVGDEEFVLQNLLRLDKKVRDEVSKQLEAVTGEDTDEDFTEDDMLNTVHSILKKVVADGKGVKFVKHLGTDLLLCMKVLERWTKATQPGE